MGQRGHGIKERTLQMRLYRKEKNRGRKRDKKKENKAVHGLGRGQRRQARMG